MSRKHKDWLTAYEEYTENTEPPALFKTWTAMSCLSGVLQRKCRIEMGIRETFPNMFIVLVGPSGVGKGQAMWPGRQLLREVGVKVAAESITREALIREMRKAYIDSIDPIEGIIYGHSSLTVHSLELVVFLGHQNRQFIMDLCDLYDCDDRWEYRTKDPTKTDEIIGVYLNLLGGITPAVLQTSLPPEAIGGGLTSRMICVYETEPSNVIPIQTVTSAQEKIREGLIDDLFDIKQMAGKFRMSGEFMDLWMDWYVKARENPPFTHPQFEGYCTRRPLHLIKMSMIICASESSKMLMTAPHFNRALELLKRTELNMTQTFEGVGEASTSKIVNSLMVLVGNRRLIPMSEVHTMFFRQGDRRTIEESVKQLCDMNYLTREIIGGQMHLRYKEEG